MICIIYDSHFEFGFLIYATPVIGQISHGHLIQRHVVLNGPPLIQCELRFVRKVQGDLLACLYNFIIRKHRPNVYVGLLP